MSVNATDLYSVVRTICDFSWTPRVLLVNRPKGKTESIWDLFHDFFGCWTSMVIRVRPFRGSFRTEVIVSWPFSYRISVFWKKPLWTGWRRFVFGFFMYVCLCLEYQSHPTHTSIRGWKWDGVPSSTTRRLGDRSPKSSCTDLWLEDKRWMVIVTGSRG